MSEQETLQTRARLLQAAGQVFADVGYRDATVRQICQLAEANIAAVNYHFGGKDELYAEVLQMHFADTADMDRAGGASTAPPEHQLTQFVALTVDRMLNETKPAWQAKLAAKEITDPTPHLDTVAEKFMRPHFARLRGIIDGLTPGVPDHRRRMLALSAMGEIVFYLMCKQAIIRIVPEQGFGPDDRREIAEHISETILAAARELRQGFRKGDGHK